MIMNAARHARRLALSLYSGATFYTPDVACQRVRLGSHNAGFTVNPSHLNHSSVVYSFGIGEDISFDLACIEHFGCQVHAFDPTPRSLAWLLRQTLPERFHPYAYGIAAFDGTLALYPPVSAKHVSFSLFTRSGNPIPCPVFTLSTIMGMLGHRHINLLKLDIEGAEYDVIDLILSQGIWIEQLCVEFHHRWKEIGATRTSATVDALRSRGYEVFSVSPSGNEFSFLNTEPFCERGDHGEQLSTTARRIEAARDQTV